VASKKRNRIQAPQYSPLHRRYRAVAGVEVYAGKKIAPGSYVIHVLRGGCHGSDRFQ